jgi:chitinase
MLNKALHAGSEWTGHERTIFLLIIFVTLISFIGTVCTGTPLPVPPENFQVDSFTDTEATLCWEATGGKYEAARYLIYIDGQLAGETDAVTYTAGKLSPSTSYLFEVRTADRAGNVSPPSPAVTLRTAGKRTLPPMQDNPSPKTDAAPGEKTVAASAPAPDPTPGEKPTPEEKPAPEAKPAPEVKPAPSTCTGNGSYKMVGYYPSWGAYQGFLPDRVDASKLTHLNYAFANIGSDLKIALGDADVDIANFKKLDELKRRHPHLKTLISVGGWTWSGRFSDAALTDSSRTAFADSCLQFILQYGFDGLDLDWEYPVTGGLPGNITRASDKQNFTLLLKKIRETFDARSAVDGREYLLTIAGGSGSWYVKNTEPGILHRYLDYAQIMTYDIHAHWDSYTDFNAPLYSNTDPSPQNKWSADEAVKAWQNAGFPLHKLVLGIPFYGYRYRTVTDANNGLYQNFTEGVYISYKSISDNFLNAPGYQRHFHPQSRVPWIYNGTTFISYEDEESIGHKADYIKSRGLAGAMIWELSHDPDRVLLHSLYRALH